MICQLPGSPPSCSRPSSSTASAVMQGLTPAAEAFLPTTQLGGGAAPLGTGGGAFGYIGGSTVQQQGQQAFGYVGGTAPASSLSAAGYVGGTTGAPAALPGQPPQSLWSLMSTAPLISFYAQQYNDTGKMHFGSMCFFVIKGRRAALHPGLLQPVLNAASFPATGMRALVRQAGVPATLFAPTDSAFQALAAARGLPSPAVLPGALGSAKWRSILAYTIALGTLGLPLEKMPAGPFN